MKKRTTIRKKTFSDLDRALSLVAYNTIGQIPEKVPPSTLFRWKNQMEKGELPAVKLLYEQLLSKHLDKVVDADAELGDKIGIALESGVEFVMIALEKAKKLDFISPAYLREVANAMKILSGMDIERKMFKEFTDNSPKQLELDFLDVKPVYVETEDKLPHEK